MSLDVITVTAKPKRIEVQAKPSQPAQALPIKNENSCCIWLGRKIADTLPKCVSEAILCCFSSSSVDGKEDYFDKIPLPLRRIIVSYCDLEVQIVECIKQRLPHLQFLPQEQEVLLYFQHCITKLDLQNIRLGSKELQDDFALHMPCGRLEKILQLFPALTHLDLSNIEIGNLQYLEEHHDCSKACLSAVVRLCPHLRELNLSHNKMTNRSLLLLQDLSNLQALDLTGCTQIRGDTKMELLRHRAKQKTAKKVKLDIRTELLFEKLSIHDPEDAKSFESTISTP